MKFGTERVRIRNIVHDSLPVVIHGNIHTKVRCLLQLLNLLIKCLLLCVQNMRRRQTSISWWVCWCLLPGVFSLKADLLVSPLEHVRVIKSFKLKHLFHFLCTISHVWHLFPNTWPLWQATLRSMISQWDFWTCMISQWGVGVQASRKSSW